MTSTAEDFSEYQVAWLRSIYSIVLILFCFNLTFAIYNYKNYIYPIRENSKLITLFYSFILVTCISHFFVYIDLEIQPRI